MRRTAILIVLSFTVPAVGASPKLRIFVTDHSGTSPLLLIRAQQLASRLLKLADVDSSWKPCLPKSELPGNRPCFQGGSLNFSIRILPSEKARAWPIERESCGTALAADAGEHGFLAIVDAGCVARIAPPSFARHWIAMMAHVMAHEIGHLLLGRNSHAPSGLMSANWSETQLALLADGRLQFAPNDSAGMRDAISLRAASTQGQTVARTAQ